MRRYTSHLSGYDYTKLGLSSGYQVFGLSSLDRFGS